MGNILYFLSIWHFMNMAIISYPRQQKIALNIITEKTACLWECRWEQASSILTSDFYGSIWLSISPLYTFIPINNYRLCKYLLLLIRLCDNCHVYNEKLLGIDQEGFPLLSQGNKPSELGQINHISNILYFSINLTLHEHGTIIHYTRQQKITLNIITEKTTYLWECQWERASFKLTSDF
jgi:hypothetical protein